MNHSCIPGINPTWSWCVIFIIYIKFSLIFRWGLLCLWASLVAQMVKNSPIKSRRPGFDHWVRKIPWRRDWLPIPVFLPGEFHGQRSLAGKESDMTEWLTLGYLHYCIYVYKGFWPVIFSVFVASLSGLNIRAMLVLKLIWKCSFQYSLKGLVLASR